MKKRYVSLALIVCCLLFVGCGKGAKEGKAKNKELVISSWDTAGDALKENADAYMKEHQDVKITVIPSDAGLQKVIPNLISGKGAPDIIHTQARDFSGVLAKFEGQFLDITEEVQDIKADFVDAAWGNTEADGKIFAMPWDIGPTAVYYRSDYFDEAGIKPAEIKTWDQFIDAGIALQKKMPDIKFTRDGGLTDYDHYQIFLNQLSGNFVKDGKIDLLSPESIKAFELIQKMYDSNIIEADTGDVNRFTNGEVACVINPVWFAGHIETKVPDEAGKWKVMELPAFEAGGNTNVNLGGGTLAITTQSKEPELALDFLKYCLATTEGQDVMMAKGLFPSYTPYYETAEFKKDNSYFEMPINTFFSELTATIPDMANGNIMLDTYTPLGDACSDIKQGKDVLKTAETCAKTVSEATGVEINQY